jgi:hypothetical protein
MKHVKIETWNQIYKIRCEICGYSDARDLRSLDPEKPHTWTLCDRCVNDVSPDYPRYLRSVELKLGLTSAVGLLAAIPTIYFGGHLGWLLACVEVGLGCFTGIFWGFKTPHPKGIKNLAEVEKKKSALGLIES